VEPLHRFDCILVAGPKPIEQARANQGRIAGVVIAGVVPLVASFNNDKPQDEMVENRVVSYAFCQLSVV
jgi:hypothetical protein